MPTLYVVATPIGNLSDASPRMVDVLSRVDLVAAEDTRVTGNLLRHFGISKAMTSLHRHNEAGKAEGIILRMVEEGIDVGLVTDAGTPGISDPGYMLVDAAWDAGVEVIAIAGPTAMAAALSISGFDVREFAFYGFLPRERGDLARRLKEIAQGVRIAVLHESPHRIIDLMQMIEETLPGCMACVCCDLTKLHEKSIRGTAGEVLAMLRDNPKANKGEYCVVLDFGAVNLPAPEPISTASIQARIFEGLMQGMKTKEAIDSLVRQGIRKNDAKRAALEVKTFIETLRGDEKDAD